MQVSLLSGPAGSGKTFRCLSEAREALLASPEGRPLLFLAPKQGTYQLEQRLLLTPSLAGYTRLFIVSFESLSRLIFEWLVQPEPRILSEEGRIMVLRALLAEKREELKLFRASARLTGFAQQLSQVLSELQRARLTPAALRLLAAQIPEPAGLSYKLQDLATLLEHYLGWLAARQLQDQDALSSSAAELLRTALPAALRLDHLWVDGFAEFSELELELLCALVPRCAQATVTFCLEPTPPRQHSWLSHWSLVQRSFERCQKRFSDVPGAQVIIETLSASSEQDRFSNNPALRHLARYWNEPHPYRPQPGGGADSAAGHTELEPSVRLVSALDREQEAVVAAREILQWVRLGGRYRDVSVVVRQLELYQTVVRRVFSRYQIPFFLDRRELVSHHPLAELTRGAMRAAAFGWQHADWFAALKSGLVPVEEQEIDLLENEALARGWTGRAWLEPIRLLDLVKTESERERLRQHQQRLEQIRRSIVPPFEKFYLALAGVHSRRVEKNWPTQSASSGPDSKLNGGWRPGPPPKLPSCPRAAVSPFTTRSGVNSMPGSTMRNWPFPASGCPCANGCPFSRPAWPAYRSGSFPRL